MSGSAPKKRRVKRAILGQPLAVVGLLGATVLTVKPTSDGSVSSGQPSAPSTESTAWDNTDDAAGSTEPRDEVHSTDYPDLLPIEGAAQNGASGAAADAEPPSYDFQNAELQPESDSCTDASSNMSGDVGMNSDYDFENDELQPESDTCSRASSDVGGDIGLCSGSLTEESESSEDEDDGLPSSFAQFSNEKLPNTEVTKMGAIAAVMAYAVSHGLTWAALGDLIKLINFLIGQNALPQSTYTFRKLWCKEKQDIVQYHYFCETCGALLNVIEKSAQCPNCRYTSALQKLKDCGSFFIILNLHKQLSFAIESTKVQLHENLEKLQEPQSAISDVTSAQCYSRMRERLPKDDLTLTINTDGSPV
ncbi:hypothetical protein V5799_000512 [Amblyomma americanum]|uniref:Uncharacterized protein n=1 Tax=Amblyomma americanum TaxID=6943 RepID=A0AAQ4D2U6_AMBAM